MQAIINNKEQKLLRLSNVDGQQMSRRSYNMMIGLVLSFGLALNAIMTQILPLSTYDLMVEYPIAFVIGFLLGSFGAVYVIYKSNNPAISFIGYVVLCLAFGLIVTLCVQSYTDATIIRAFVLTLEVTAIMILAAVIFPQVFLKMGRMLFAVLVILLLAEVGTMLLTHTDPEIFDIGFAALFSLYIGYDWQKSQAYPPTLNNAIDSAADIYVDIINLFIRLLAITGRRK